MFESFLNDMVSLSDVSDYEKKHVGILRDTGAAQTFILDSVLPFSNHSSCGSDVLVDMHTVHLWSDLVSGIVKVLVRPQFTVAGASFILENDLEKVTPLPEVELSDSDVVWQEFLTIFSAL